VLYDYGLSLIAFQISIKSMESHRLPISEAVTGQSATFAIRTVNRKIILKKAAFRKGMALVDGLVMNNKGADVIVPPKACREFEASVIILQHSTTIGSGYQPVIHCGVLRQSAEVNHLTISSFSLSRSFLTL
jgi:GTPase